MLVVTSAVQASVNVMAMLWSHPPFLASSHVFSPCAGRTGCVVVW